MGNCIHSNSIYVWIQNINEFNGNSGYISLFEEGGKMIKDSIKKQLEKLYSKYEDVEYIIDTNKQKLLDIDKDIKRLEK